MHVCGVVWRCEKRAFRARGEIKDKPLCFPAQFVPLQGLLAFDLAAEAGFLNPDLSRRIAMLYQILDSDSKGSLRYDDMVESLRKIPRYEAMHLSTEDFQNLTDNYRY